jgi:hypothetical protein
MPTPTTPWLMQALCVGHTRLPHHSTALCIVKAGEGSAARQRHPLKHYPARARPPVRARTLPPLFPLRARNQHCPLVLYAERAPRIDFMHGASTSCERVHTWRISRNLNLCFPLLTGGPWQVGGGGAAAGGVQLRGPRLLLLRPARPRPPHPTPRFL